MDGSARVKEEPFDTAETGRADHGLLANAEASLQVETEGFVDPADDRAIERPPAGGDEFKESAAVVRARQLAAPKGARPRSWKRISRQAIREKFGADSDSSNLLRYHRSKLRCLLAVLMQRKKWHHASGVLSILLGIPESKAGVKSEESWSDFTAAMEVFRRVGGVGGPSDLRIKRMIRFFTLQQPNARARGKVQLELALYLMKLGEREAAYDELRPIVDNRHYREDPVANLCHGVNSHSLWHDKALEDVSKMEEHHSGIQGLRSAEGTGENDAPEEARDWDAQTEWGRIRGTGAHFGGYSASQSEALYGTDNGPSDSMNVELDSNIWQASQRSIYEETDEQGFVQTGEEFWRTVSVPSAQGLDPRLFPVPCPRESDQKKYVVHMKDIRTRDLHAAAIKHLKQALDSAPDMLSALLPLVQLLLAVHDIEGAVAEIDKCSQVLKRHVVPPSIKVALLETVDQVDPSQLSTAYRNVLTSNPLSASSLRGLINLHTSGKFETGSLLECICLHLDVDPGDTLFWQKLASCLLVVEQELQHPSSWGDEKLMMDGIEDDEYHQKEEGLGQQGEQFSRDQLRRLWSGRYRWWLRKHFKTGGKQQADDAPHLLAYKAACASHIYGPGQAFVEHARSELQEYDEELRLVEHHCEKSLRLFEDESKPCI